MMETYSEPAPRLFGIELGDTRAVMQLIATIRSEEVLPSNA
jgi:hypothetical protein